MKMYLMAIAVFAVLTAATLPAATVPVPNASFEAPLTPLADPRIDSWQDYPKPDWFVETPEQQWDFLTGVFTNLPNQTGFPIDNMDGGQCAFLFAVPQVGFFQDFHSVDWADTAPTHEFNATFQSGKAYRLSVGVIGGGGGMPEGASMGIALYYRDPSSNMVFVAMTNVTHSVALFPSTIHFVDIALSSPVVKASDAWASQNIGIAMFSTIVDTNFIGGYWDLDNVRLEEIEPPRLVTPRQGEIVVQSEPGLNFEILASSNLGANWTRIGAITNTTGNGTFIDSSTTKERRFYSARLIP